MMFFVLHGLIFSPDNKGLFRQYAPALAMLESKLSLRSTRGTVNPSINTRSIARGNPMKLKGAGQSSSQFMRAAALRCRRDSLGERGELILIRLRNGEERRGRGAAREENYAETTQDIYLESHSLESQEGGRGRA